MSTALVFGSPGCRLACGLWQSVQSPAAPGCCTFAVSISLALSSWQGTQRALALGCVSTSFPSFAGAWQTSHCLSAKGGWVNFAISLGAADWCGSWQLTQLAVSNGLFWVAFFRAAPFTSWHPMQ